MEKLRITFVAAIIFALLLLLCIYYKCKPVVFDYYNARMFYHGCRNDISFFRFTEKATGGVGAYFVCHNGYIIELRIMTDNLTAEYAAAINSLTKLKSLRLWCWLNNDADKEELGNLHLIENIEELQIDYEANRAILPLIKIPDCVHTVRLKGLKESQPSDEELLRLVEYKNIKTVLAYGKQITKEGVEEFKKLRPDVAVWWLQDIDKSREGRDFWKEPLDEDCIPKN